MVSGSTASAFSTETIRSRNRAAPHREAQSTVFVPPLRSSSMPCTMCRHSCGDRFIPVRSSMDMDFAQYCLTGPRKEGENNATVSPSKEAYRKSLAEICFGNRTRILEFKHKPAPSPPVDGFLPEFLSSNDVKSARRRRCISQKAEKILEAPNIMNDYYLNLLDWGSSNVLAIALGYRVYLWNASNGSGSKLLTVVENLGPVTSVSWAPDGQRLLLGYLSSFLLLGYFSMVIAEQHYGEGLPDQILVSISEVFTTHHSVVCIYKLKLQKNMIHGKLKKSKSGDETDMMQIKEAQAQYVAAIACMKSNSRVESIASAVQDDADYLMKLAAGSVGGVLL